MKKQLKFASLGLWNTGVRTGSAYSALCLSSLSKVCKHFFSTRDFALGNPDQKLAPWWVTGITDAEGCFSIFVQKTSNGIKIILGFKVTQKAHSSPPPPKEVGVAPTPPGGRGNTFRFTKVF